MTQGRRVSVWVAVALFHVFSVRTNAEPPEMIHYQGYVTVAGTPFTGGGLFKFALVSAGGNETYWSHDGSSVGGSEPATALNTPVNEGLYSILLGSPVVPGMTESIPATVFAEHSRVFLRIWFDDGVNGMARLTPDTPIASVGYAMVAASLSGGAITGTGLTLGGDSEVGEMTLLSDDDQRRLTLDAGDADGRASLRLYDQTGAFDTVRLVGAESGSTGAQLLLRNGSGNTTLEFDAQDGGSATAGGVIRLKNDAGENLALFAADIDNGNSGLIFYDAAGLQETLRMTGAHLGTRGAFVTVKNANGDPTVQLFGQEGEQADSSSVVQLSRSNGAPTVTLRSLGGDGDGGGLLLGNGGTDATTVELLGDAGENQGRITLRHSDMSDRIRLDADGPNNSGELKIHDSDGTETIQFVGGQGFTKGGSMNLRDASGDATITLDGDDANNAGRVSVKSDNEVTTIELIGRESFNGAIRDGLGSILKLSKSSGTRTVEMQSRNEDGAGEMRVYGNEGQVRAQLSGDLGEGKGALTFYSADGGTETARFVGAEFGTEGAQIVLKNAAGNTTIELDGQGGQSSTAGSVVRLKNDTGDSTIILDADANGEGKITTEVLQITGGSDLSEQFEIRASSDVEPERGMIVCIDPERPGELRLSDGAYDPTVAGVISGAGGVKSGMLMGQTGSIADGRYPVALTGRVYCWVDADHGAIRPGDMITSSPTPGHGMRADPERAAGSVVGKAMTPLEKGRGLVLTLVTLQ